MYRRNKNEGNGLTQAEQTIDEFAGQNENTLFKDGPLVNKSAMSKRLQNERAISDEIFNEEIMLESGGVLEIENY